MIEVTILFLDQTFCSTATGPMEVFRTAGTLWNSFTGMEPSPRFRVTTASIDGRAVSCDGPIQIQPTAALNQIRKTDIIFNPSTGISLDDVVERNAPVVPWLRRWEKAWNRNRQRLLRRRSGRGCWHARWQARYHPLEPR